MFSTGTNGFKSVRPVLNTVFNRINATNRVKRLVAVLTINILPSIKNECG